MDADIFEIEQTMNRVLVWFWFWIRFQKCFSLTNRFQVAVTLLAEVSLRQVRLACTLSFACLVFRVVGLFTSPERDVIKPTARNTRHANDNVHAKRTCRRETSASRVSCRASVQ